MRRLFPISGMVAGIVVLSVCGLLRSGKEQHDLSSLSPVERLKAVNWCNDSNVLKSVAARDRDPKVRGAAIMKIRSASRHDDLFMKETSEEARRSLAGYDLFQEKFDLQRLAGRTSNHVALVQMLLENEPWQELPASVTDTNTLHLLAERASLPLIRRGAVERLRQGR